METRHHLLDTATLGMRVNVVGCWADVIFATPAYNATGNIPKSTAPISLTSGSARAPPPQLGREAGPNAPHLQFVHSVNSTVCQSLCSVSAQGVVPVAFGPSVGHGWPPVVVSPSLVSSLRPVEFVSPLIVSRFQIELWNHPDRAAVSYLLEGLKHGFRVGFSPSSWVLKSSCMNMWSAIQQPSVIDDYLQTEIAQGRIAGPFPTSPFPYLHVCKGLDLNNTDHIMLWAACCVGFFGFLRAGEFTVNSTFDPDSHLSVCDLQVDCLLNPSCLKIHIKC